MKKSTKAINTVIASAFVLTLGAATMFPNGEAQAKKKEKCYGVVKAGQNGCGDSEGRHSCEGQSTVDGDGTEWISLPKGVCDKIVGGSTEPKSNADKDNG